MLALFLNTYRPSLFGRFHAKRTVFIVFEYALLFYSFTIKKLLIDYNVLEVNAYYI